MSFDFDVIQSNINNDSYPRLGVGSGRRVFDLENGFVVKVAKNKRGLAQNKTEVLISEKDESGLIAKILAVSSDSSYLIMEKTEKIKHISVVWDYFHVKSNREMVQLPEFQELSIKYELLFVDLYRPINWGLKEGRPVIIDYGFTKEVKRQYYSMFRL